MAELKNGSQGQPRPFQVGHREVVTIAVPTTLAFLTTPLLGLVDMAVVGRLDDAALIGGLAIGAILFDIIFTTFNFMRASTTALVAQAMGRDDDETQRIVLLRALLLSAILGALVWLASPLILWAGQWAMSATDPVQTATAAYFTIRILAAPLTLINYTVLGWLLGQARAGTGLVLQTVLNGTNIVLSIVLGYQLGWGLEGVAWATVIAEGVAALLGFGLVWRAYGGQRLPQRSVLLNGKALRRLFDVNRDIMIRSFALLFAFAFFTAQGTKFGETTLAANAILMNFFLIAGYFLDGFATSAEQLAGRAIGANYRPAFDKAVRLSIVWGFALAVLTALVFFGLGSWLITAITTNAIVQAEAFVYLPWAAIIALVGVLAFIMDGVFIGATWSRDMRNMMLLSLLAYLVVWWIAVPALGNHGLWLALHVFLGARGLTLLARIPKRRSETFTI